MSKCNVNESKHLERIHIIIRLNFQRDKVSSRYRHLYLEDLGGIKVYESI